jgi:hypothetical protein
MTCQLVLTLLEASTTPAANRLTPPVASLYDNLNFNFIRDIAPVASISTIPLVMEVNASVPAYTIPEFVAYAKANPGKINMASGASSAISPKMSPSCMVVSTISRPSAEGTLIFTSPARTPINPVAGSPLAKITVPRGNLRRFI